MLFGAFPSWAPSQSQGGIYATVGGEWGLILFFNFIFIVC